MVTLGPRKTSALSAGVVSITFDKDLKQMVTTQIHAIIVASMTFHRFLLAGKHFNFLGDCVGSSKNSPESDYEGDP